MSDVTPTRRDFLRTAAAGAAGLALAGPATARPSLALGKAKSCIFINMVGGPAHLDTFDPKPDASSDVRGPFAPIQTKVPGVHLSELFPKLAGLTDKFSLIRSMHHDAPPVHECGFQLLNTGRLFRNGPEWPSVGAVLDYLSQNDRLPGRDEKLLLPSVIPGNPISTGVNVSHGLGSGFLGSRHEPQPDFSYRTAAEFAQRFAADTRPHRYGGTFFGDNLGRAVAFAASGTAQVITVNMFDTVFDSPSWDSHADGGSLRTNLDDIRNTVAPSFDTAFATLLSDLEQYGVLDSTLVVATGEFGRTPKLNSNGGRDHWAGCWTALVAGGGTKGGQVIGRSDATGSEPADRPVSPQELVSSIFHALGVPHNATIPGPDGAPVAVYPGVPVAELF